MMRRGFSVMKLNEDVIRKFARHLPSCHCVGKNRGIYDDAPHETRVWLLSSHLCTSLNTVFHRPWISFVRC
jgi:hypothetical protein